MKNISMYFMLAFVSFFINCGDSDHSHHHHSKDHSLPASEAAQGSLYDLDNQWMTENNTSISLKDYKNTIYLLSMFYSSCQSVCPRIISDMDRVALEIQKSTGKSIKKVIVSFDPENDKPEVLKKYKEKMKLDDSWSLLVSKEEEVRSLSVALGINYKKNQSGDFNHSAIISLISKEGFIVSRLEGIGSSSEKLIQKFSSLQ